MDRTKTNKWMGCVWGAVLAAALLAGCSTGQVPNQRVYDRYAALMQERRQQQMATQSAAAAAADREQALPAASPAARQPAAKPADEVDRKPAEKAAPAPKKPREAVAKPAPAPAAPVAEPEAVAETAPAPAPAQDSRSAEVDDGDFENLPEETRKEPEQTPPPPPPPPVEVLPPAPAPAPAETASASETGAASAEMSAYALRVGDGVAITLRGIPTPEKIECQVDEYGMIPLPLINDVKAEGLSAAELQKNIRQIYLDRGIYKNINVTVLIPTRYYYTQGEFKNQGKFQIVSAITLSQAIAASGYFTDFASGEVYIRRNGVIFKKIRNARKLDRTPEDDILIEPNDIIEAVRSWI